MLEHDLKALPVTKPVRLHNVICPYCGVALTQSNRTKEHVVGRKFVPKGTLENNWNLILNACRSCNNRKADLEDDIGAITMQPDLAGQPFGTHPQLALDAAHKGRRAISRHTRKAVAESRPTLNIKYNLGPGLTLSFNMIGQAQITLRSADLRGAFARSTEPSVLRRRLSYYHCCALNGPADHG